MMHWQWPWALLAGVLGACAIATLSYWISSRSALRRDQVHAYDLDDAFSTEEASLLLRRWKRDNRIILAVIACVLILGIILLGRPAAVSEQDESRSNRDIILCLDVSGSTLPYDREVIATYQSLVSHFKGERIGLSIFNSTSRTVFPLTDDYDLVEQQLEYAHDILGGVQSQDDIDQMDDQQYQQIANWLDGTQNRKNATSLIGDGVVSCAAMLPGFTYDGTQANRSASIVLATDNVVSGDPTYTLSQALDLTSQAHITVDGLYSGPQQSESDEATIQMRDEIEAHGGLFLTQSDGSSINELVRSIDRQQSEVEERDNGTSWVDAPGWWTLILALVLLIWFGMAMRLRR